MKLFTRGLWLVLPFMMVACQPANNSNGFNLYRSPLQMVPPLRYPPSAHGIPKPTAAPLYRPLPELPEGSSASKMQTPTATVDAVITAERAKQSQMEQTHLNAIEEYRYERGAVYSVVTSPGFLTVLELQPGEQVMTVSGGDSSNWLIDTVDGGADDARGDEPQIRTSVLIKPKMPFLKTNLVITTDRRLYHLDLASLDQTTYHATVRWKYADDDRIVMRRSSRSEVLQSIRGNQRNAIRSKVHYRYTVWVQRHQPIPAWAPQRVFDDGRQVFIELPKTANHSRRPVLFSTPTKGTTYLINYRVQNGLIITQALYGKLELRLGTQVVRIDRANQSVLAPRP